MRLTRRKAPVRPEIKVVTRRTHRGGERNSYEVLAPNGYRFTCELHAHDALTLREATDFANEPLEPCPPSCTCKG